MALIVQKFGGTSVGSVERIQHVAQWALDTQAQGNQVVLVVSAMAGETNRLVRLATEIDPVPYSRAYDLLVASGEQVSVGLLSLALNTEARRRGLIDKAQVVSAPLLAYQLGMRTDAVFSKARIQEIDTARLRVELEQGHIPVVAGFQGIDGENNITTLGRGGSDTSAVAVAAALRADQCEIYTDVDGVYTTDPRLYSGAKKHSVLSYDEMMEFASLGAKVLQIRSVEVAAKYGLAIHVRSSFNPVEGTLVVSREELEKHRKGKVMEQLLVSGVAADRKQVKLTVKNLPARLGLTADLFDALSAASIVVDVIVMDQEATDVRKVSFTCGETDRLRAHEILDELSAGPMKGIEIEEERDLAKVSVVGVGMQNHPGVASKMFRILSGEGIAMKLISTSEIKISCLIEEATVTEAVAALHRGFELDSVE
jgi:aspartate kinase